MSSALLLLTHVASQMVYKWLPISGSGKWELGDGRQYEYLFAMTVKEWCQLLKREIANGNSELLWLRFFHEKNPNFVEQLAFNTTNHLTNIKENKAALILINHALYPEALRNIDCAPLALSCVGNVNLLKEPGYAVIGSRKASSHALSNSYLLGKLLAERRLVVISGGAYGCDIAAHRGVLKANNNNGYAIVVFAGGLSNFYPRAHSSIFKELLNRGALFVSERLWLQPAKALNFPARNRIISGMAEAVFIMQAASQSGTMITALSALDQGRDVYVLKHCCDDIRADGSQQLISEGALEFSSAQDVFKSDQVLYNQSLETGILPTGY